MNPQIEHVNYTRHEWTTVPLFIKMINFLKDKNIKHVADIGSNVGEVSKIFLENIPTIEKIYAYEPESENFNFLKNRFLNETRVIPIKKGIFYGFKSLPIYNNGGSGSHTIAEKTNSIREIIELTEIENENLNKLDLIKIDIEGAEYNVLRNSSLLKETKYLIIEFHPFGMDNQKEFESKLPPVGIDFYEKRTSYIKEYTDFFVKKHLSNFNIIVEENVQYLLELK